MQGQSLLLTCIAMSAWHQWRATKARQGSTQCAFHAFCSFDCDSEMSMHPHSSLAAATTWQAAAIFQVMDHQSMASDRIVRAPPSIGSHRLDRHAQPSSSLLRLVCSVPVFHSLSLSPFSVTSMPATVFTVCGKMLESWCYLDPVAAYEAVCAQADGNGSSSGGMQKSPCKQRYYLDDVAVQLYSVQPHPSFHLHQSMQIIQISKLQASNAKLRQAQCSSQYVLLRSLLLGFLSLCPLLHQLPDGCIPTRVKHYHVARLACASLEFTPSCLGHARHALSDWESDQFRLFTV